MAVVMMTTLHGDLVGITPAGDLVLGSGRPFGVTAVAATDGANVTKVTIQVVDINDTAVAGVFEMDVILSDATDGSALTATTASGAVADKTTGTLGTLLVAYVAKKAFRALTNASGVYVFNITDTGKTAFKIAVNLPMGFRKHVQVPLTLAAGSYG